MKITISGWAGTGKSTTATMLAQKLGHTHFSGGGIFRTYAEEKNLSLGELERQAEQDPEFDLKLDAFQKTLADTHDNFVLESRLGWHFVPRSIKVLLTCEDSERVRRIAEREGDPVEDVEERTKDRERSITKRYRDLYRIENFMDAKNFDLVVDTTNNTPEEVTNEIIDYIQTHETDTGCC